MAITKTYLGNDLSAIRQFLSDTGLFGAVTLDGSTVTCKDADNVTLLTIERENDMSSDYTWTLTAHISGNHTCEKTYPMLKCAYGYNCSNGAMLSFTSGSAFLSVLLSKTNQDRLAVILPKSLDYNTTFYGIAYSDTYPVVEYKVSPSAAGQTVLSPFITNAPAGATSYTPDAFYMPFGAYVGRGYAKFTMNGKMYMTDGNWVISDGQVSI